MSKRLLDYDPLTRVSTYHAYDAQTDMTWIEEVQDVEPYLERNKALQTPEYSKQGIKNEWWHVATIPVGIQYKWLREDGINIFNKAHWPAVKRKLMDPDYRYLRTGMGRL